MFLKEHRENVYFFERNFDEDNVDIKNVSYNSNGSISVQFKRELFYFKALAFILKFWLLLIISKNFELLQK